MKVITGVIIIINMRRLRMHEDNELHFWVGVIGFVMLFIILIKSLLVS
jgi:hypothetical protein